MTVVATAPCRPPFPSPSGELLPRDASPILAFLVINTVVQIRISLLRLSSTSVHDAKNALMCIDVVLLPTTDTRRIG